jgi:hypothetical protein
MFIKNSKQPIGVRRLTCSSNLTQIRAISSLQLRVIFLCPKTGRHAMNLLAVTLMLGFFKLLSLIHLND